MKSNNFPDLYIANMLVNDGSLLKEDKYVKMATFLVREVCDKNCYIVGYSEAITGELVANRRKRKYALRHGYDNLDVDAVIPFKDMPGDILWRISSKPANEVLTDEEIINYLTSDPQMMSYSLNFFRYNTDNFVKKESERKLIK